MSSLRRVCATCAALAVVSLVAACGSGTVTGAPPSPEGIMHLAVSLGLQDGIASVRVDVSRNGAVVASRTVDAPPAGSDLPLGDAYFVLPPGLYSVEATPFDLFGRQSEVCQVATASAVVVSSVTTEVTLALYCGGNANGGLDVVVTTTHPPVITDLEFNPSKFTHVCEPVVITAQASSPDNVAFTYTWDIVSTPPGDTGQPPPGAPGELATNGAQAVFDTQTPGDYTLVLVVTDANGHTASLSFPVHVLPGDACTPIAPGENTGATDGKFIIGGHVRDALGAPIVGARITLSGAVSAIRYSDLTGLYVFHVNVGDYALAAASDCEVVPSAVDLGLVTATVVQDFAAAGDGCVTGAQTSVSPAGSQIGLSQRGNYITTVIAAVEPRGSATGATDRLQQIATVQGGTTTNIVVNGRTGLERQLTLTLEQSADPDMPGVRGLPEPTLGLTTAVAMGSTVVRFEAYLPADADPTTIDLVRHAHRNTTFDGVGVLAGPPRPTTSTTVGAPATPPALPSNALFPGPMANNATGELEIAASDTQNVAFYATQLGVLFRSVDGGLTVQGVASPGIAGVNKGDPVAAVGAPDPTLPTPGSQAFYFAQITSSSPAVTKNLAVQVFRSTDAAVTFTSPGGGAAPVFAIDCNAAGSGCVTPDQPMLAADRHNQALVAATGLSADQLYMTWRVFGPTSQTGLAISCSTDAGRTWSTPDVSTLSGGFHDFPRLSVAADGTVLVVYDAQGFDLFAGVRDQVMLQAFSSCASGLVPMTAAGFPVKVGSSDRHIGLNCMAGLDRCATANYMVTGDDSVASSVFVTYAMGNGSGGDDVHVAQSTDGGKTFISDLVVNSTPHGARFMPWICSSGGRQFVAWYDRRDSSVSSTDLTSYFHTSLKAATAGGVAIPTGGDFDVSGVDDPECRPGFSGGVRDSVAELGCTDLPAGPIFGGVCMDGSGGGSLSGCDFRSPSCPSGESCKPGGGNPNFGDYNGAACAMGKMFVAWASSTPPAGLACAADASPCALAADCCSGSCVNKLCASAGTCNAGVCVTNGAGCTKATDCATGNCQGGVCLPDIGLYVTSSSCSTAPCRAMQVVLSAFNFHTTGFNLGDHNPNFHIPNGADASGNVTLTCQPQGDGVNTILPTPVTAETQLGCFDGWGFYVDLTCAGTGTPGSLAINGSITFTISDDCTKNHPVESQEAFVGPLPGPANTADLNVCHAGFDVSNPPPCSRNQLAAHAVASSIASP